MLEAVDWGFIDYNKALENQESLALEVANEIQPDHLIFCTHPPVVTLGRSHQPEDIESWKGDVVETSRGGRATYHGPSQQVIYPIINLNKVRSAFKTRDVHAYLRHLETIIIESLKEFSIEAEIRKTKMIDPQGRDLQMTGVWVDERKLASIGIAVRRWTTYHGVAINLEDDPQAFKGINPCGFSSSTMISVEELLGKKIDRSEFNKVFYQQSQRRIS